MTLADILTAKRLMDQHAMPFEQWFEQLVEQWAEQLSEQWDAVAMTADEREP